jgi:epoxide hydrolase 4
MVLLHGFPDHEGTYAAQVADFARDHLVVAPRLRGFPPSSIPSDVESYALPIVAEDVAALVEHFGQGPAIVVGHDWGGALAQAVALRFPSLVTSLILLNTPILSTFNAVVTNDPEQQAMSAYTLPYLRYQSGDDKNIAFVTRNIRDPDWRATISHYLEQNSIEGMMAYYKANYPAPPYNPQPPAWMAWRDTTRPHCAW